MQSNTPDTWPGDDDRRVVESMLNDKDSPHWTHCRAYIAALVAKETRVPPDRKDDVVQNVMMALATHLSDFRFESRFTTWLRKIFMNCVNDEGRRIDRDQSHIESIDAPKASPNSEGIAPIDIEAPFDLEQDCITREQFYVALKAALKYAEQHKRWKLVIRILSNLVFREGKQADIARQFGISSARVSQISGELLRHMQDAFREFDEEKPGDPGAAS